MSEAVAAAATTAATEAATPANDAGPASAMSHGLDVILGDLTANDVEAADSAEQPAGEGEGENAEPTEEQDTTAKGREAPDDLIFSDEQLSTPEGIKRGRARVNELRKLQHQKYLELKGYERHVGSKAAKLKTKVSEFRAEKQTQDLLVNNVRSNLQAMYSGNKEAMVAALGHLTGKDGIEAVEEFISVLTHGGKPKLDPRVQSVLDEQRRQIEELRNERVTEKFQAQAQQLEGQIGQKRQAIAQSVLGSTTTPHLTRIFKDDQGRLTNFFEQRIYETNGTVPLPALMQEVETELRQHFGVAPPTGTSGGTAPKQPQSVLSSPGRSVGPSVAAAATQRMPTEEESLRSLANDTELLSSLGL